MIYSDALVWLLSLPDMERGTGTRPARESLFLERPAALLDALGNPQTRYRSVLVAGTKGKGSTAAMLHRMLKEAGHMAGLYTSPHLHSYRERIQVADLISEADLARGVGEIQPVADALLKLHPEFGSFTTFEIMTVLALAYFARAQVDIAILEVGLGGRLDATNVVDADLSVITPISFDHTAVLGNTLPKIAREKAGIIKAGKIVLSAPQHPEALSVIEHVAQELNAALGVGGRDWIWLGDHDDFMVAGIPRRDLWQNYWQYPGLRVALRGVHQLENAALVVAAAQTMIDNWDLQIKASDFSAGLERTEWAGRLEILHQADIVNPLMLTDGAHNGDSAEKLFDALKFHFKFEKLYLILGILQDKDVKAIAAPFVGHTEFVWTVKTHHPRSRDAADLAMQLNALGLKAHAAFSFDKALERARERANPRDLILITGSLSIVAQARQAFGLVQEQDPPLS